MTINSDPVEMLPGDEALAKLMAGNARFVAGQFSHPNQTAARREDVSSGSQHPFAIILACSDSRVPPEVIFDRGIGDLFIIQPAVERAKNEPGELVPNAIRWNALLTTAELKSQPVLAHLIEAGRLKVVAAHYDLDSGKVTLW